MSLTDWNPQLYLKYNRERIQPSIDLVARINAVSPARIVDIGCGPGNSTHILKQRWPHSTVVGIDSSRAMIDKARADFPEGNWQLLDAGKDDLPGGFDIVFSNATLQWIPDHSALLATFKEMLNDNGALAVQVPMFFDMPLGQVIERVAQLPQWATVAKKVRNLFTIHSKTEYYDLLTPLFRSIELWQTEYVHVMDSAEAILEMIRSTGLKPYLDCLETNDDKQAFEGHVLLGIKDVYPEQKDGKVLFPFNRLFFVASD